MAERIHILDEACDTGYGKRIMARVTEGRFVVLAVLFAAGLAAMFAAQSGAAELDVSAGEPATVGISVPANASAGEPFTAKVEVRDRFGNVVTDYDRRGAGFELSVVGRGEIWPKTVQPKLFDKGVADVQIVYRVAERIEITVKSLKSGTEKLEGRSAPFNVAAGKLSDLRVITPMSARAGSPFRVTLMALDAYGNVIKDFQQRTDGVVLSIDGPGALTPARVPSSSFAEGTTEASVTYTGTGEADLRARDPKSNVTGKSPSKIKIGAGDPASFKLTAPESVFVDEPFDIAVTALDRFGNVVLDYDAVGTVVYLGADGTLAPSPSEVSARKFSQGVAFVKISYGRPENISLAASEPGTQRLGASGRIDVKPGRPKQIEIAAPAAADAGSPFTVTLRTLDSRGNVTTAPVAKISLSVLGSIGTTPIDLTGAMFKNGAAERKLTYNIAEEIVLTAKDAAGELRADPVRVRVKPGPISTVDLATPPAAAAGAGIAVTVTAMDEFHNVVTDVDAAIGPIRLFVDGPDAVAPTEVQPAAFSQGKAAVTVPHFRAAAVRVVAEVRGKRVTSGAVEIVPGPLHHFDVATPVQSRAGEPFSLTVTARDAYGNTVTDYNRTGSGAQIQSTGVGEIQPGSVSTSAFRNGVAQADIRSFVAERIVLTVFERFGSATGRSAPVRVAPGPLAHFLVSVSPKIRAGELFPIRIEAQDMYYNVLKDFSYPGRVRLSATGQSTIVPNEIGAADFGEGIAVVQAYVTGSGATELSATTDDKRASGRSNPFQVVASTASTYRVDVLDAVRAGEPFRIRVTAQDAYGNVADDPKSIGGPLRLDVTAAAIPANSISPATLSPALFSRGIAEAFVVFPQAGRITIQVKSSGAAAESAADWKPQVDGLFFKAAAAQTDIYLLASGPLEYRAAEPVNYVTGVQTLVVHLPNSSVLRSFDYDALTLPGLRGARVAEDVGMPPRLILKFDAAWQPAIEAKANMIHVTLRPAGTAGAAMYLPGPSEATSGIPSLDDVQAMIDRGEYRAARKAIELYLSAHPGHPEAAAMRSRLEKVLRVLGE